MKIGLFITDDIFIKEQLLAFMDLVPRLGLEHKDFHIFVKPPRVRKVVSGSGETLKLLERVTVERIRIFARRIFLKRMVASRWRNFENLVSVRLIDSINSSSTQVLLEEVDLDVGVFTNFDEIVKAPSLSKIKRAFNMHNGILPDYRGCQPIVWQMLGNEKLSAMTFHVMTEGIDDGDIVFECPFHINHKQGVYYNNIQSFKSIPPALFFGLRRVLYCDAPFARQSDYSAPTRYFRRPSIDDLRKIYARF